MKNLLILIALSLSLASCITDDRKGVRICFDTYKEAVLNKDAATALKQVDKKTIDSYRKILLMALTYDSARLEKEPYMDKVSVLISRHFIDRATLSKMDGPNLFMMTVEIGLIDEKGLKGTTAQKVKVMGDRALLSVRSSKGELLDDVFVFYHEDDRWKMNLSELSDRVSTHYEKQLKEMAPAQVNANLLSYLEEQNGEPVSPDIWKPIN